MKNTLLFTQMYCKCSHRLLTYPTRRDKTARFEVQK